MPAPSDQLAQFVAGLLTAHKEASTPIDQAARVQTTTHLAEGFEGEAIRVSQPLLDHLAQLPDLPSPAKEVLEAIAARPHQFGGVIQTLFVWGIMQPLVASVLSPFTAQIQQALLHQHPEIVLSPAEAALGVLKGSIDHAAALDNAQGSGINATRFEVMLENTGEPIPLQEALLLYRRGQIDQARLERIVRQSRVRNEYLDAILELRFAPPSPAEAIAGAVEGHLSQDRARELVAQAGIDPAHFDWLYATAGRPPGAEMMLRLLNRGIVTEEFVREAIRESDVKNKYIDAIIESRRYLPPVRSIAHLFETGAVSRERALQLYADDGVAPEDAQAYLTAASHSKTSAQRDLSVSQVAALYEDRVLDRGAAQTMIEHHGYEPDEANLILELADLSRERKFLEAAVSRFHNLFVGHKIDAVATRNALGALGITNDQITDLMRLWTLEREANVRVLTPAQITRAARLGIMTEQEALSELVHLGYGDRDAAIVLALAMGATRQGGPAGGTAA